MNRSSGTKEYTSVYFTAFDSSSLRLTTTVYYDENTRSECLISDINLRVNKAFAENGIEIPFNYVNVIFPDRSGKAPEEIKELP